MSAKLRALLTNKLQDSEECRADYTAAQAASFYAGEPVSDSAVWRAGYAAGMIHQERCNLRDIHELPREYVLLPVNPDDEILMNLCLHLVGEGETFSLAMERYRALCDALTAGGGR